MSTFRIILLRVRCREARDRWLRTRRRRRRESEARQRYDSRGKPRTAWQARKRNVPSVEGALERGLLSRRKRGEKSGRGLNIYSQFSGGGPRPLDSSSTQTSVNCPTVGVHFISNTGAREALDELCVTGGSNNFRAKRERETEAETESTATTSKRERERERGGKVARASFRVSCRDLLTRQSGSAIKIIRLSDTDGDREKEGAFVAQRNRNRERKRSMNALEAVCRARFLFQSPFSRGEKEKPRRCAGKIEKFQGTFGDFQGSRVYFFGF